MNRSRLLWPLSRALPYSPKILETLLDAAISRRPSVDPRPTQGVIVGTLVGFMDNGATPLVAYPGQPGTAALAARTTVDVHGAHIASEVVLLFESGDPSRPIIVGRSWHQRPPVHRADAPGQCRGGRRRAAPRRVGEHAAWCCAAVKASVTLSADGTMLSLRGTHVVSHASGLEPHQRRRRSDQTDPVAANRVHCFAAGPPPAG